MVAIVGGLLGIAFTGGALAPAVVPEVVMVAEVATVAAAPVAAGAATGTTAVVVAAEVAAASAGAGAAAAGAAGAGAAGATAASAATAGSILSGPIGWITLGATDSKLAGIYTFDCWKAVLNDDSPDPSNGKILKEVMTDPRIKQVTIPGNNNRGLPQIFIENVWDQKFRIDYVDLIDNQLAAHAVQIE